MGRPRIPEQTTPPPGAAAQVPPLQRAYYANLLAKGTAPAEALTIVKAAQESRDHTREFWHEVCAAGGYDNWLNEKWTRGQRK